jgi:ribosome biogenesis GTPase / thiamine phosphate phosphatase
MFNLTSLGWNEFFEHQFIKFRERNFVAARIAAENKQRYILFSKYGELNGEITGKLLYASETNAELPKIGDWVAGILFENENKIIIHSVLERKTKLSRKVPDRKTEEQIIASNIDIAFIVQVSTEIYNIRRLERYITTIFESKAEPVIILNKVDLNDQHDKFEAEVKKVFPEINIILTNALDGRGIYHIRNS